MNTCYLYTCTYDLFNIKFEQYKLKLKIIPCSDHCIKTLLMLILLVCMTFQFKLRAIQLTVPSSSLNVLLSFDYFDNAMKLSLQLCVLLAPIVYAA